VVLALTEILQSALLVPISMPSMAVDVEGIGRDVYREVYRDVYIKLCLPLDLISDLIAPPPSGVDQDGVREMCSNRLRCEMATLACFDGFGNL
jgi:hypothetical protein